jgi:hypothetical protein
MELLRLYWRRLSCWSRFVGREGYFGDTIGPVTAWRVACSIHPLEDLTKWWLGTGWMGPGCPDWYCGHPSLELALYFKTQNEKQP